MATTTTPSITKVKIYEKGKGFNTEYPISVKPENIQEGTLNPNVTLDNDYLNAELSKDGMKIPAEHLDDTNGNIPDDCLPDITVGATTKTKELVVNSDTSSVDIVMPTVDAHGRTTALETTTLKTTVSEDNIEVTVGEKTKTLKEVGDLVNTNKTDIAAINTWRNTATGNLVSDKFHVVTSLSPLTDYETGNSITAQAGHFYCLVESN